jgi:hypothetical protein
MGEASEPFNKSWTVVVYVRTGEGLMSRAFSINPSLFDSQGTSPIFRTLAYAARGNSVRGHQGGTIGYFLDRIWAGVRNPIC